MPVTYAIPMSLVMRTQECTYCGKMSVVWLTTFSRLHGIKCCEEHVSLGKRDTNACLREEGMVRQRDFLEMYPRLRGMKLNIPRTNGSITEGGNLSSESFQMFSKEGDDWRIPVLFTDPDTKEILGKTIKITQLEKSGISKEEIVEWTKSLNEFYREDYEAFKAAMEVGEQAPDGEAPFIRKGYADGREVRFVKL